MTEAQKNKCAEEIMDQLDFDGICEEQLKEVLSIINNRH
jgi:hypothetical protein